MIRAWISVAQRYAPDATRACQPATVSHPDMRVSPSCCPVGNNAARTCNVAKKIPARGRSEHCDPMVLTAGSRCPCRRSFSTLKKNATERRSAYIEASSPNVVNTDKVPTQATKKPYTSPAGPPLQCVCEFLTPEIGSSHGRLTFETL